MQSFAIKGILFSHFPIVYLFVSIPDTIYMHMALKAGIYLRQNIKAPDGAFYVY
jgi:hypothetical protein